MMCELQWLRELLHLYELRVETKRAPDGKKRIETRLQICISYVWVEFDSVLRVGLDQCLPSSAEASPNDINMAKPILSSLSTLVLAMCPKLTLLRGTSIKEG